MLMLFSTDVFSQEKEVQHETQAWVGYMTSLKLNDKFSLWNDFHLATDNFLIGRHGVTYHFNKQVTATGGYAWLFLSTSFSDKLERKEHRPWVQLMFTSSIGQGWQTQQRFRYDARFREKVEAESIVRNDYVFNHRLRYMFNIRKSLDGKDFGKNNTFLSLNNEILVNFGENIRSNYLDQYRVSLLVGRSFENMVFQLGYMYRFVPVHDALNRHYHGITLWVNHNFKNKKGEEDIIRSQ